LAPSRASGKIQKSERGPSMTFKPNGVYILQDGEIIEL
jgi:hypothetical protein